jgi:hypothetical protein
MKKPTLASVMAAGLALATVSGAYAAATGVLNPTPNRESRLIADFETKTDVTADPDGAGENRASINTDTQFAAEGKQSLQVDMTGVAGGWHDHEFTVNFAQPIDIKGYQVLAMDVYVPDTSLADTTSYYQLDPRTTTTNADDPTMTTVSSYGPRNLHTGWNHPVWNLQNGTDTTLTQLDFSGNSGADYTGPIYVDNIRLYKGNFAGLQPDEKPFFSFDNSSDASLFAAGDANGVTLNTDKQFITEGTGSLEIDLTGQSGGYTENVVRADDLGTTLDVTNATAIHLDIFVPTASAPANGNWHGFGFGVVGESGSIGTGDAGIVDGQWNTLEIPLSPDQATTLGAVKGLYIIRNQGDAWQGPVYVDNLRVVVPTPPVTGGTTAGP